MSKLSVLNVMFPIVMVSSHYTSPEIGSSFNGTFDEEFYGHILQCNDNEDCIIDCSHHDNVCRDATIKCPEHGNCRIDCHSGSKHDVCTDVNISCPHDGDCALSCHDESACANAWIDARDASHFSLSCGSNSVLPSTLASCPGLTVYFPLSSNGSANAKVSAGDDSGLIAHSQPLQFYAVNGWADVDIVDYTGSFEDHSGQMHCGYAYDHSCDFHAANWSCANWYDDCNGNVGSQPATVQVPTTTTTTSTAAPSHSTTQIVANAQEGAADDDKTSLALSHSLSLSL